MIEAYELTLRQRVEQRQKQEEAELQAEEEEQATWNNVFMVGEELLAEQGSREAFSLIEKVYGKYIWLRWVFESMLRPYKSDELSRLWSLEKDVDLDGETKKMTVAARAEKHSPRNADRLHIGIGELSLVLRKNNPLGFRYPDGFIRSELYIGDQEVTTQLADANFFKEVIAKAREQTPATAAAS